MDGRRPALNTASVALVAKVEALEPGLGFTFDTLMLPRPRYGMVRASPPNAWRAGAYDGSHASACW
jgi:hypothetical protein